MAPKRATRSNIAPETTNTTSFTNAQLQAMINQGVTATLVARDADYNTPCFRVMDAVNKATILQSDIADDIICDILDVRSLKESVSIRFKDTLVILLFGGHAKDMVVYDWKHSVENQYLCNNNKEQVKASGYLNTNGDDSHISGAGVRRTEQTAHEFTYTDFLKCQPLNFKGTEGVIGLSQWFERMESVFHISNCTFENQVKFATYTLHSVALTWWNTHVKTVGHDAAYGMPWKTLMKMMTDKYYPGNEIKKLEMKIWDLKVKGADLTSYTQPFQELALLYERMFPKESDKIKKYVSGLPDMIHRSVVASKPKTMQDAVEIATELMDKKIHTFAEC
ncbi:reverse transcriptase domain-containing protein [Tanacetum coccineum]|uniref:Reverse transcriptase domain-containing protein n=1 Tax=Tanacetum coccineum TaxID=301880 RepID=A0ABQ5BV33_9ASTR